MTKEQEKKCEHNWEIIDKIKTRESMGDTIYWYVLKICKKCGKLEKQFI